MVEKAKAVIENKPPKIPVREASPFVSSLRIPGMTQGQLESHLDVLSPSFVAPSRDESFQFQQSAECLELLDQIRPTYSVKFGGADSNLNIVSHRSQKLLEQAQKSQLELRDSTRDCTDDIEKVNHMLKKSMAERA